MHFVFLKTISPAFNKQYKVRCLGRMELHRLKEKIEYKLFSFAVYMLLIRLLNGNGEMSSCGKKKYMLLIFASFRYSLN